MCLIYDKSTTPVGGWKADRDIVCYKLLKKNYYGVWASPVFNQVCWKEEETKKSPIVVEEKKQWYYAWWLFGWDKNPLWTKYYASTLDTDDYLHAIHVEHVPAPEIGSIGSGLYSYSSYMNNEMKNWFEAIRYSTGRYNTSVGVARCVIPKGATYYVADDAQVFVSDTLRVEEIVVYTYEDKTKVFCKL